MTRTVQILRVDWPRCTLRNGVGLCTATTPCMNTFATCGARDVYDDDGGVTSWYFSRPGDPIVNTAARPSDDVWHGYCIPAFEGFSDQPTRVNIAAARTDENPLGIRGELSVTIRDSVWRNQFGDYYDRDISASMGRLWLAWIGEAQSQLTMTLYTGYAGDELADMTARRYYVEKINPPSGGAWTIQGVDPLAYVDIGGPEFPRETELTLLDDIDADQLDDVVLIGAEDDITDVFGNDGRLYVRIGDEVISYTSATQDVTELEQWTLNGVRRGAIGTTADEHSAEDPAQRWAYFQSALAYEALYCIYENHTRLGDLGVLGDWTAEGKTYLSLNRITGGCGPTDVWKLSTQMMRDGMFTVFWDERAQEIDMIALRQPNGTVRELTDADNIMAAEFSRYPDQRITRVRMLYDVRDPTGDVSADAEEFDNFGAVSIRIDGDAELPKFADGEIRPARFASRWARNQINVLLMQASMLQRYRVTPEYLQLDVTRKDSDLRLGDVVDVAHSEVVDLLGGNVVQSWQLIQQPQEVVAGERYRIICQSFTRFERPAFIAPDDAPDYASATGDDLINTCYITEDDGTMPDGSTGWVIQ